MKNLINAYPIKYNNVICPEKFLFLLILSSIKNKIKFQTDSYKNVGCTYFVIPFSIISIFNGKLVSVPYASIFM